MTDEPIKKIERMSDVIVPPTADRFSTMIPGLDVCLAEHDEGPLGIPLGTSFLISGEPGGGKSTITTFMAAAQAGTGRENAIFCGEESPARVKARWQRLGLVNGDPYVIPLLEGEKAAEHLAELGTQSPGGLGVIVFDSVQSMRFRGSRKYDAQAEAVEYLCGLVVAQGGCPIFVNHVSKSGKDPAGAMSTAHYVDVVMHLTVNAKRSTRSLEVRKNRIGRAAFAVDVNVTGTGITIGAPAAMSSNGSMVMARNQLEHACNIATFHLMKGDRLDGYSMDLANVDGKTASPGAWRAGLEMAVQRLVRDGFEVTQSKINGRKGWQMTNPPGVDVQTDVKTVEAIGQEPSNDPPPIEIY
jgi:hypothetical protein